MWIIIGAVLGGCVQDFVILGYSLKRDGRSLGKMASDEIGPVAGFTALIGVLMIMVILIAVLGLVVVNAMKHSIWATSTVAATVPIAMLVGIYMTHLRPGRLVEGSVLGVGLMLLAVLGGRFVEGCQLRALLLHGRAAAGGLDHRRTDSSPRSCRFGCCSRRATTSRRSSKSERSWRSRSGSSRCIRPR